MNYKGRYFWIGILLALLVTSSAQAGGLYLYELGAPDVGAAAAGWSARAQDAATVFTNPPAMKFFNGSKKSFNTVHANNFEFYHELAHVIERVPVGLIDPELRGLFALIGIEKDKKFAPDDRMRKILAEAVAVGNATARAIWIRSRDKKAYFYKDSGWYTGFVGGNHEFLKNGGSGGCLLVCDPLRRYGLDAGQPIQRLLLQQRYVKEERRRKHYHPLRG